MQCYPLDSEITQPRTPVKEARLRQLRDASEENLPSLGENEAQRMSDVDLARG